MLKEIYTQTYIGEFSKYGWECIEATAEYNIYRHANNPDKLYRVEAVKAGIIIAEVDKADYSEALGIPYICQTWVVLQRCMNQLTPTNIMQVSTDKKYAVGTYPPEQAKALR